MYSNTANPANRNKPDLQEIPRNRKIRLWLRKLFHVEQFDRELP